MKNLLATLLKHAHHRLKVYPCNKHGQRLNRCQSDQAVHAQIKCMDVGCFGSEPILDTFMVKDQFYLVAVEGCVEPSLHGPYKDMRALRRAARKARAKQDIEDALFWMSITETGEPNIGSFISGEPGDDS